ncbi:MAG: single-stranded DNA-binding protein [Victivallales bacterium]|nr:single-stranded DNA-binding protein [Victivallales bacterium]
MAYLNKVLLMGNLTRDPQSKALQQTGTPLCDMGMAINRRYKTQSGEEREEVVYVDLTIYGHQADYCVKNMVKGMPVYVEGHLKFDSWQDKDTNKTRSKLRVIVDNIFALDRKSQQGGDQTGYPAPGYGQPAYPPAYGMPPYPPTYGLPPQHPAPMPYPPPNAAYNQPFPQPMQPQPAPQPATTQPVIPQAPTPQPTVIQPPATQLTATQPATTQPAAVQSTTLPVQQPAHPAPQPTAISEPEPLDDSPPPESDEIADDLPF